jgi:hypothetical protein
VTGEGGGRWLLLRSGGTWSMLAHDAPHASTAALTLGAMAAARLWYSGRRAHAAAEQALCDGDRALCDAVLAARALMV